MDKSERQEFRAERMEYAGVVDTDQGKVMARAGDYVCILREEGGTKNWLMREGDFNSKHSMKKTAILK